MRYLLFFLLFVLGINTSFAQDTVSNKTKWYGKARSTTNLFVHFDKNVYANKEDVWFTGYLIKTKTAINKHKIMSVVLIRDIDSAVVLQDKFVLANGISHGNVVLPDSLLTGDYHFLAYTDRLWNGIPEAVFIQPITLKTNIDPVFKASIKVIGDGTGQSKSQQVLVAATTADNRFLPKPLSVHYRYGNISKNTKTDASGQVLITLPQQTNLTDPNVYVKLKNEKDSSLINIALPQKYNRAKVKFYPEGGRLVNGLISTIGWEVKDQQQMPVALKAFLYQDNVIVDTIETSSNGIGKFRINAATDKPYWVKLIHSGFVDSSYYLPAPVQKGAVLTMKNAIVSDTVQFNLRGNGPHQLTIIVHNFNEEFLTIPFNLESNHKTIKIPLSEIPKGLATITILDSLARPLAERIFFAHYSQTEPIAITTNQTNYKQREKVNLKLKLNLAQQALVSIACVQENRIEGRKMNDIESYTYLNNELKDLPLSIIGRAYSNLDYLDQVLLVKGWRRYDWQNDESTASKTADSLLMTGKVTKGKKELIAPIDIGVYGDSELKLIQTSTAGLFDCRMPELTLAQGKKTFLFINDAKNALNYTIQINDPFIQMNEKLAKLFGAENKLLPSSLTNNAELVLKGNEKAFRLKEVVIKTKKDDHTIHYSDGSFGANAAGDYVCFNGILNCRNHVNDPGNRPAINGERYSGHVYNKALAVATGEKNFLFKFKGIHLRKEFYEDEYKDPQEPAYFSTIYWKYGTLLEAGKETELNFYTSDITGKFKIVVQGITNAGVVYAEKLFEVKNK